MQEDKPEVLITRRLDEEFVSPLREHFMVDMWPEAEKPMPREQLLERIKGKAGLLCMLTESIDEELLAAAGPPLKTISTMSVGFDHIDVNAAKNHGLTVGYTPDVLNDAVADLTIALMLNAGRRLPEAARSVIGGNWGAWSPYWMTGQDLSGSTVGLIGLGSIAETVARRLQGFDCRILYHSRSSKPELEQKYGLTKLPLEEVLSQSDFVSVHAPLTGETKEMFNAERFGQMKQSAVFINTSRGGLVNQNDLFQALKNGTIYAAGLDVTTPEPLPTDNPLLSLPNCLVLPHIGSASIKTRHKMTEIAIQNLVAGVNGETLVSAVQLY
jgi:lactate dehydrogenase-like 2-hydroxyacid dehydrogenase